VFERAGKYNFVLMPIIRMSVTILKTESAYSFGKLVGTYLHRENSCAVGC
jgi:hypothetical protein